METALILRIRELHDSIDSLNDRITTLEKYIFPSKRDDDIDIERRRAETQ